MNFYDNFPVFCIPTVSTPGAIVATAFGESVTVCRFGVHVRPGKCGIYREIVPLGAFPVFSGRIIPERGTDNEIFRKVGCSVSAQRKENERLCISEENEVFPALKMAGDRYPFPGIFEAVKVPAFVDTETNNFSIVFFAV